MEIDRVAIIGAGPCGLGAAKYLIAERKFNEITIFEQRKEPGGVWNYTGDQGIVNHIRNSIPNATPSRIPKEPVNGTFVSPIYDSLETNIPNSLMQFCDAPFPPGTALFPTHNVVKQYLHRYAEELRPFIRFSSLVIGVSLSQINPKPEWAITWRDIESDESTTGYFDAVVVANGHHNDPNIPIIPGIAEWGEKYPGSIIHSADYRRNEPFTNKKVIVVGHSASGIDIASQISQVSKYPLLISERTEATLSMQEEGLVEKVPEIAFFDAKNSRVQFANGREDRNIDHIVFCTGYHFSIPFLSKLEPEIITDGLRPHGLFQHVFYAPQPTLALVGVPQRIVPFPFSQAQGAWIARVFAGRLSLPSRQEMEDWIEEWKASRGDGRSFNTLAFPLDAEYINSLHYLSSQAAYQNKLKNNGNGKQPPFWGAKEKWTRGKFPEIKKASQGLGSQRAEITSLEQLGFSFEENSSDSDVFKKAHL